MRHVSDHERRTRLGARHALAPATAADSPETATRAMTVLHATEPATVYLSCWARVPEVTVAEIDRALFDDRSLVKQLAMRRTLFVFPRDLLPAALPSASARVAGTERARMAKDVVLAALAEDGELWLDGARAGVLDHLATAPEGRTAVELRQAVPELDVRVERPGGNAWGVSRVLIHLGLTGHVVRGANTGHWRTSRPRWTLTGNWLGADIRSVSSGEGYRELVRRWLYSFGPGTEEDIVWWLGATKSVVRTALAELGAVAVSLERDETGWLMPDDLDEVGDPGPWVALLPVLDPTVMGWQGRTFYLGQHGAQVFEARGNAGTTAWVNGRVVGCWVQDAANVVRVHLLEEITAAEGEALDAEAERLTRWLAGERVGTGYVSPAMKSALLN